MDLKAVSVLVPEQNNPETSGSPKNDPDNQPPPTIVVEPAHPAKTTPLVAALCKAMEKKPLQAKKLLEKYDKPDRELLLSLLRLTADVEQGELAKLPPEEVEQTLEQLYSLTLHLRQRAPLSLGKVCFCRQIKNFGQYTPLGPDHQFQAGCDGQPGEYLQIYAEVRNFGSQLRDGQYETVLASSLEFYHGNLKGSDGKQRRPDVTMQLDPCTDRSQSPRQDYFLNFQFHVPRGLPPGLYTLLITVKDVTPTAPGQPTCARVAKRSLDFKVCPPGATANP